MSPGRIPKLNERADTMVFTKRLRDGIRRGRIRCSIRIWTHPHVKVGGRYQMDEGHIVVDSIAPIAVTDITYDLARESGFESVDDLLQIARHGRGDKVYLIRFHYLPPGAWDTPRWRHRQRTGRHEEWRRFHPELLFGRSSAARRAGAGCTPC